MKKKKSSKKKAGSANAIHRIRWKLMGILLPVSIIPMIIIVAFVVPRVYGQLERSTNEFYTELLNQVSFNIDFIYKQYARTLANIYNIPEVRDGLNAPPYTSKEMENRIRRAIIGEATIAGGLRNTVEEKIDGFVFLYEMDRSSLIFPEYTDHIVHRVSNISRFIFYDKMVKDPLFLEVKNNNKVKMILGKFQPGVLSGFNSDSYSSILFPYYRTPPTSDSGTFTKFMVVLLNESFIQNFYKDITKLRTGTLYVLDNKENILSVNHPGEDDYYEYNPISGQYELGDDVAFDPFERMSFNEYQLLNTDPAILQKKPVRRLIERVNQQQDGEKSTNVTFNGTRYLVLSTFAETSGVRLVYFHPVAQIHKPVRNLVMILIILTIAIIAGMIIASFVLSGSFATPIETRTEELTQINEKLKELDTLKNDFIANITHDFRSPLTIIMNKSELALKNRDYSVERIHKTNQVIFDAALKLRSTIDKLLDLAKMDMIGVTINVQQFSLRNYFSSISEFYSSAVLESGIKIIYSMPDEEITDFYTDPEKFEEIVSNLISNAIKFVDKGSGLISIAVKNLPEHVQVSVTDNGIGIPKSKLRSIFNRFEQVKVGDRGDIKGTGIGLAFARQLAGYLKAKIWAESEGAGKGATFIVQFKKGKSHFKKSDFTSTAINDKRRAETRKLIQMEIQSKQLPAGVVSLVTEENREGEYDYQKGLILIVDDNQIIRDAVFEYLNLAGYKNMIMAADGNEALEAAYRYKPDLIICDYNMPNMKGDEFHDILSKNKKYSQIPFIFLSAVANKNIILERKKKGAVAYLQKPIDEKDFLITVENCLKQHMNFLQTLSKATIDGLTGLLNKTEILKVLYDRLSKGKSSDMSLIFLDIDHFKQFNDTWGHHLGDKVLKVIGAQIKKSLRDSDLAGRYGGEEFIVILNDTSIQDSHVDSGPTPGDDTKGFGCYCMNENDLSVHASFGVVSLKKSKNFIEKNGSASATSSDLLMEGDKHSLGNPTHLFQQDGDTHDRYGRCRHVPRQEDNLPQLWIRVTQGRPL
jgi:diguanylate cyclase (GGDEF)-like protein